MANKDAINATIALIENDNKISFCMTDYITKNDCGTFACLAGYASIARFGHGIDNVPAQYIEYPNEGDEIFGFTEPFIDHYRIAQEFFDIDEDTAIQLFVPHNEHIQTKDKEQGIKVLEALRDTGTVIWDYLPYKGD